MRWEATVRQILEPGTSIIAGLSFVALAFFGRGALRTWRRRQLLVLTPEVSLSALRPGFWKARGRIVAADAEHTAPITTRSCVYYELEVEERRGSGKSRHWYTVVNEERASQVEIDDGTGRTSVALASAELVFALDHHISVGLLSSASEHVEQVLSERYGESTKGVIFNKKMRIRETFLELGDELFVMGPVAFSRDGLAFREGSERFVVSDRNLRGVVRAESRIFLAWLTAGILVLGLLALLLLTMGP